MSQTKPRDWVRSEAECVFWLRENPPLHSIFLPPCILSPPTTQLLPITHPTLGLQGLSRLGVIPVHHEIHQEAGHIAHGEIEELGVPTSWVSAAGMAGGQGVLHAVGHQGQISSPRCLQKIQHLHYCPEGDTILVILIFQPSHFQINLTSPKFCSLPKSWSISNQ